METPRFRSHTLKQGAAVKRTTADGAPGVSRPGEPVQAGRASPSRTSICAVSSPLNPAMPHSKRRGNQGQEGQQPGGRFGNE